MRMVETILESDSSPCEFLSFLAKTNTSRNERIEWIRAIEIARKRKWPFFRESVFRVCRRRLYRWAAPGQGRHWPALSQRARERLIFLPYWVPKSPNRGLPAAVWIGSGWLAAPRIPPHLLRSQIRTFYYASIIHHLFIYSIHYSSIPSIIHWCSGASD